MRRNGLSRLTQGFADGYAVTNGVLKDIGLARAAGLSPEEKNVYSPEQGAQLEAVSTAKDVEGNPLYQVSYDDTKNSYMVMPTSGGMQGEIAPARQYVLGGKIQAQPFTDEQIAQQRLRMMGDVSARFGDPVQAAHFQTLADKRRDASDQDEIRDILSEGRPAGLNRVSASGVSIQSAGTNDAKSAIPGLQKQSIYLDTISQRVMDAYLRQGKVAEAKSWRDFAESEHGLLYANDFAKAQRLTVAGAYDEALPILQRIHQRDLPDGREAKLTNLGNGNWQADVIDQATGMVVNSKAMSAADLARGAVNALSPTKMVEFMVQQQGKRDAEGALLDRQIKLEDMRQKGQEVRDDRRDERLQMRFDHQDRNLERRLSHVGLTTAQQRSNAEIEAAREAIAGLSPQDIVRRTAKATNTGRENLDYDPNLARQAALANRRMLGTDEWFDQRQGRKSATDSVAGKPVTEMTEAQLQQLGRHAGTDGKSKIDAELARRTLAGMPQMQGHQIGQYIEGRGYQVLDPQGRPVSYLRRKPQ